MRKVISISALLSSVLATPLFAVSPVVLPAAIIKNASSEIREEAVPDFIVREAACVEQMQALQRRINAEVQDHLRLMLSMDAHQLPKAGVAMPFRWALYESPVSSWENKESSAPRVQFIAAEAHFETLTFLGVTTSVVPPILQEQLKLPRGFGLIVDYVEKNSPADQAGIKVHDILQKMDDQLLVNGQQLATLVRSKKTGDTISLTALHEGQPVVLSAKLAEKKMLVTEEFEVPLMPDPANPGVLIPQREGNSRGNWQSSSRMTISSHADGSVTRTLVDNQCDITLTTTTSGTTLLVKDHAGHELYNGPFQTEDDKKKVPAEIVVKVDNLVQSSPHLLQNNEMKRSMEQSVSITRSDNEYQLTLTINQVGRTLVAKDNKTGKSVFDGPVDTVQQRSALPAEVAQRLMIMEAKIAGNL